MDYWQTNFLLEAVSGKKLLIDCGTDIRHSLAEQGYQASDIDLVYISHDHADHIGGLEWLGFCRFSNGPTKLITSIEYASKIHQILLGSMSRSVKGGSPEMFFDIEEIDQKFEWEGYTMELVPLVHVFSNNFLSYGLFITNPNGKKFYFSTDSSEIKEDIIAKSDLTFHDCETADFVSNFHTRYEDLYKLNPSIKQKIVPVHYNPNPKQKPVKDGMRPFSHKGDKYKF